MEPITSAAQMGITMTLWILVYTASGAAVLALLGMLFLGFVGWLRPMGMAGGDPTKYMYRWPTAVSRGWIAFFAVLFMITEALGAAFMHWVGDNCACSTGSNIWIAFISLLLILPFLIMLAGIVFVVARAFVWHAVLVFFIMASAITIFVLGQVYVWVYNNTLYSQLGAWFTIGLVLITPVWFYWAYIFARDNNELASAPAFAERYAATFHPEEVALHEQAAQVRLNAHTTSESAWREGVNRLGDDPIANYVVAGRNKYLKDHGQDELRSLINKGLQSVSGSVALTRPTMSGVGIF